MIFTQERHHSALIITLSAFVMAQATSKAHAAESVENDRLTARQIMWQVNERDTGDDYKSVLQLKHTNKRGKEKIMELASTGRSIEDGQQTLLKFMSPSFMKNSGVLLHGRDTQQDRQWLFLSKASRKEPRRISNGEKGKPLFGTDIYYIDIEKKDTKDFDYSYVDYNEETYTAVIKAIPKNHNYPYSATISWVDTRNWIENKVEFFREDEHIKTLNVNKTEEINHIWTVMNSTVENHKKGSKTDLLVKEIHYNQGLSGADFSFKSLTARQF